MKYYIYAPSDLPDGFRFPKSYLDLLSQEVLPDLKPWLFLAKSSELADIWLQNLKEQYPDRRLVPFALFVGTDDVACFDGDHRTDNPIVYYVHTFTPSGWEHRGEVKDFEAWLMEAKRDAAEYKAAQDADD